jgi:hypothetical protein
VRGFRHFFYFLDFFNCSFKIESWIKYHKYSEITSEYAIRGTYCDLAIVSEKGATKKYRFLIEVKAISVTLD